MTGVTIKRSFRKSRRSSPRLAKTVENEEAMRPVSKLARMLALAHHIERSVDSGNHQSNAEVARTLGLTRARITQVMNLLLLAPEFQARILSGQLKATERSLRGVVREPSWETQLAGLAAREKANE